jgi:hypothetical protein
MNIRATYTGLFRGLRRYYADREGDDSTATFSAMAALSAMFIFCLTAITIIATNLFYRDSTLSAWTKHNHLSVLGIWVLLLLLHRTMARRLGLYDEPLPDPPASWVLHLRVLLAICVLLFAGAVGTALYIRR